MASLNDSKHATTSTLAPSTTRQNKGHQHTLPLGPAKETARTPLPRAEAQLLSSAAGRDPRYQAQLANRSQGVPGCPPRAAHRRRDRPGPTRRCGRHVGRPLRTAANPGRARRGRLARPPGPTSLRPSFRRRSGRSGAEQPPPSPCRRPPPARSQPCATARPGSTPGGMAGEATGPAAGRTRRRAVTAAAASPPMTLQSGARPPPSAAEASFRRRLRGPPSRQRRRRHDDPPERAPRQALTLGQAPGRVLAAVAWRTAPLTFMSGHPSPEAAAQARLGAPAGCSGATAAWPPAATARTEPWCKSRGAGARAGKGAKI